jgi:mitogen-activated protein kinase 1/3
MSKEEEKMTKNTHIWTAVKTKYKLKCILGEGAYGQVIQAKDRNTK